MEENCQLKLEITIDSCTLIVKDKYIILSKENVRFLTDSFEAWLKTVDLLDKEKDYVFTS